MIYLEFQSISPYILHTDACRMYISPVSMLYFTVFALSQKKYKVEAGSVNKDGAPGG